jgi:hypothetical protein
LPLPGIDPRSPDSPARSQTLYSLSYPADHQCHYSPINEPWPLLGFFSIQYSQQIYFYRVRLCTSRPTPNLEDQAFVFIPHGTGLLSYTPGHWVARVPRYRHFPYLLTWAPEGSHRRHWGTKLTFGSLKIQEMCTITKP